MAGLTCSTIKTLALASEIRFHFGLFIDGSAEEEGTWPNWRSITNRFDHGTSHCGGAYSNGYRCIEICLAIYRRRIDGLSRGVQHRSSYKLELEKAVLLSDRLSLF